MTDAETIWKLVSIPLAVIGAWHVFVWLSGGVGRLIEHFENRGAEKQAAKHVAFEARAVGLDPGLARVVAKLLLDAADKVDPPDAGDAA